ncbi:MAG: hypothetical protein SH850_08040 [Planctomycetaceae bacterium]|nr:hypothetical protein [Planctomycetaceae bacterium]
MSVEIDDERDGVPRYIPTPAEIAAATAEIRAEWSDAERASRFVGPRFDRWSVPGIDRAAEVVDRNAIRTFLGTGSIVPVANEWERGGGEKPVAMPFDD